jgi:hypothetical protein
VRVAPVDVAEAIVLIDAHVVPHGWTPTLRRLLPIDLAVRQLTAGGRPGPVEEADLFVALRRAILCDPNFGGVDDPCTGLLVAHIEPHRPVQMWYGDEECLLSECDHDKVDDVCPQLQRADRLCATCSVLYDPANGYLPQWLDPARVQWPCQVIRQVAGPYKVPLPPSHNR